MKTLNTVLVSAFLGVALYAAVDVSGTWEIDANFDDGNLGGAGFDCVVKQAADHLTGRCSGGSASLTGEIDGQTMTWRVSNGEQPPAVTTFTGTLNAAGTSVQGRFTAGGKGGTFSATKS